MMKAILFLTLSVATAAAFANHEYGDKPAFVLGENRQEKQSIRPWLDTFGDAEYGFGAIRGLLEDNRDLEMSMSLSMSMSFNYNKPSPVPTAGPTQSPKPSWKPSNVPTASLPPTLSPVPSSLPSVSPTVSPVPSILPTSAPSPVPTGAPTAPPVVLNTDTIGTYDCSDQGVILADTAANVTTSIELTVVYSAEVSGTQMSPEAMTDLEIALLEAAITAALDCGTPANNARVLHQQHRALLTSTDTLGPCNADVEGATCFVLETDLSFVLNREVNPQYATYLAYIAMKDGMSNDAFVANIDELVKLTYLAPLPLVPPPKTSQPLDAFGAESAQDEGGGSGTKNWTIGACIAMSSGGLLALGAWFYKRRFQKKHHVELADDRSDYPAASLFSAERDFTDDA